MRKNRQWLNNGQQVTFQKKYSFFFSIICEDDGTGGSDNEHDDDKSGDSDDQGWVGGWLDPILADKCDSQVRNAGEGDSANVLDNASKQNLVH